MIELSVEASGVKGKPLFTRVVMAGSRASLQSIVWPGVTAAIRRTMQGNRGKDTVPELALRSLVHAMGYRYWTHVRSLPGSPDLVFTSGSQVRRGWDQTFTKYRARYGSDPSTMGQLAFEILGIQAFGADGAIVLGHWSLIDTPVAGGGVFSVALARTPAGWKIVHDHTSSEPPRASP